MHLLLKITMCCAIENQCNADNYKSEARRDI